MKKKSSRRDFFNKAALLSAGLGLGAPFLPSYSRTSFLASTTNAANWPKWPVFNNLEVTAVSDVVNSGIWGRLAPNTRTKKFEEQYAQITGTKKALGVSSGTNALYTMLGALQIGPGDEVIIPPYTFIATYNAVTLNYALPVFVDSDIESFQIDATKIEAAITNNTKVIMPVHIGGSPFDVDTVLSISKKYNIPVIEDACQAHLASWKGKCVGNWGIGGAFSFQASKNLNAGEGGAIITNDEKFYEKCYSFHHQGQSANSAGLGTGSGIRGSNVRITEFQSAILLSQLTRLQQQVDLRSENATYLTKMLNEVDGISPAKLYTGTTRSAYHLYMFRYDKKYFSGLSKEKFIRALAKEGIPASSGYGMINRQQYVANLAKSPHYLKIYGDKKMKQWLEATLNCPKNDQLTTEAVWFSQNMLLTNKISMERIVTAIKNIKKNAASLV